MIAGVRIIAIMLAVGLLAGGATAQKPGAGAKDGKPAADASADEVKDDDPDWPIKDLRAAKDPLKRYVVIGPKTGSKQPAEGWKTLFVLPGGDGGAGFHPFVKNIARQVFGDGYVVVQLVSVKWIDKQPIIWPIESEKPSWAKFTTEDFFTAVHGELGKAMKLDRKSCYTLSWSSGGPAAYRLALMDKTPITGSYVAMSVFHPDSLPPLEKAKGKSFFIDHSPQDETCPFKQAEQARDALKKAGARVDFVTYEGGHGWQGELWDRLRKGRAFLESAPSKSTK